MIQHLTEIVDEARKRGKKRLAVAYGQDSHTLEAVYEAYKEGIVEPTLFGEKKVIEQVCAENDIDIKAFNIVDEASDVKCVQQAVAAVVAGNADVLMKGLVSTDKYMRGILNKEAGLFPPKGVLSHVSIVEMPCYHKLLVISDVAVIPLPDFKQKTVQIGYTLPKHLLTKLRISTLRIYFAAQNLYTWTAYSGYDPEVSIFNSPLTPGFDYLSYPRSRTYTVGLNLSF